MKCPICSFEDTEKLIVDLSICRNCNHIFKNIHVSPSSYKDYRSSAHREVTPEHVRCAKMAASFRARMVTSFKDTGSVLELGSGHRFFLDEIKEYGFEAEGTDLSLALIEDLKDVHKIHYGNPTDIKELKKYDVICGFHVLEHLNEPIKEFAYLLEHLNDNGIIVLEFPTLLFFGLELSPNDFYEGLHTQYFNQTSIILFLKRCGLKPVLQTNFWDGKMGSTLLCATREIEDIEPYKIKSFNYLEGEKNE